MLRRAIAALKRTLSPHFGLSDSRVETMALLVTGMISARTVNLSHIASTRSTGSLVASTYRRLQRFFQHVDLGPDWSAPLTAKLLDLSGSWHLVLDRTQWQVGGRDVNFLVLAAVTPRFRIPLIWSVIDGRGCSDTEQRILLMRRYLKLFDVSSIRLLLADREFGGSEWIEFLAKTGIPFAIRLKGDIRVTSEAGHDLTLAAHLGSRARTRFFRGRLGAGGRGAPLLNFALKRLEGGTLLAVVSNRPAAAALKAYARRWGIECMFGDAKTRGLNMEDTRLTCPRKLDLLMGLVALAIAWAARTAIALTWPNAPRRASHGYRRKSWFRTGFDQLRHLLQTDPLQAIAEWHRVNSKPLQTPGVV